LAYCSVNFDSFNAYLWNQQTFPNIFALLNASVSSRNLNHFDSFNAYLWNQQTFPNIFALLNASVSSRNLNHFMKL